MSDAHGSSPAIWDGRRCLTTANQIQARKAELEVDADIANGDRLTPKLTQTAMFGAPVLLRITAVDEEFEIDAQLWSGQVPPKTKAAGSDVSAT